MRCPGGRLGQGSGDTQHRPGWGGRLAATELLPPVAPWAGEMEREVEKGLSHSAGSGSASARPLTRSCGWRRLGWEQRRAHEPG